MNITSQRGLLFCALLLASLPAFGQSARFVWQGAAYAYAENLQITEQKVDQVIGTPVGEGAQVVFFRTADATPGYASLNEDGTHLAQLPAGAYYATAASPGTHTYVVDGNTLQLRLSPGERRYVRIDNRRANSQPLPSNALTFLRVTTGKRLSLY